ncbi:MAG: hypothetical protein JRH16_10475 [Deltaproteobacteria bacterium]|nr:hypothetical protein [Deltaproteobacteria bacterium]MBW2359366.1 hypothetical protein [Deltaproteobacteria bacterium]
MSQIGPATDEQSSGVLGRLGRPRAPQIGIGVMLALDEACSVRENIDVG